MKEATIRAAAIAAGFVFLLLGIVGLILPAMPGAVFLILAALCFSRGSRRLHRWLLDHPVLGPPIRDYVRHGVIGRRQKRAILLAIAVSFLALLVVGLASGVPPWVIGVEALILAGVAIFIVTRPEEIPLDPDGG